MVWRCNVVNQRPQELVRSCWELVSDPLFATLLVKQAEGHELLALSQCGEQKTGRLSFGIRFTALHHTEGHEPWFGDAVQ